MSDVHYDREYYDNGNLKKETPTIGGLANGEQKYWYKSGLLKSSYSYKNGIAEGEAREWYSNGKIKAIHHYSSNIAHGVSTRFDRFGNTTKLYFKNGELVHFDDDLLGCMIDFLEGKNFIVINNNAPRADHINQPFRNDK